MTQPPRGGRHLGAGVGWVAVVRWVTYILNTVHEYMSAFGFGVAVEQLIKRGNMWIADACVGSRE